MQPDAHLVAKSLLKRTISVQLPNDPSPAIVLYDGGGCGYESVYVDGERVFRKISWGFLIPSIPFRVRSSEALIEVEMGFEMWVFPLIRRFTLKIDGVPVYVDDPQARAQAAKAT